MKFNITKTIVLSVICTIFSLVAVAQPNNPNQDPDVVPISGIEILLGAGALFGAKRILDKRKGDTSS